MAFHCLLTECSVSELVECPRCGERMFPVDDRGYLYMSCRCGEEFETDLQRKHNDRQDRYEDSRYAKVT